MEMMSQKIRRFEFGWSIQVPRLTIVSSAESSASVLGAVTVRASFNVDRPLRNTRLSSPVVLNNARVAIDLSSGESTPEALLSKDNPRFLEKLGRRSDEVESCTGL